MIKNFVVGCLKMSDFSVYFQSLFKALMRCRWNENVSLKKHVRMMKIEHLKDMLINP